jgi:seryl-tRNA synthetase
MSFLHIGPKQFIEDIKNSNSLKKSKDTVNYSFHALKLESEILKTRIEELENKALNIETKIVEVIKEVPVEVIREVRVVEERIVEKEVQVIKEFPVYKEKIIKEFVDRPIETIREIEKEVVREIKTLPIWVYGVFLIETLTIVILLLK